LLPPELISQSNNIEACPSCNAFSPITLSANYDEDKTDEYQTWGPNLFAFVGNNPMNETDPTGLGIIGYFSCIREMNKWYNNCIKGLPNCDKKCSDPWEFAECMAERQRKIKECAEKSKKMFEECIKGVYRPPLPGRL